MLFFLVAQYHKDGLISQNALLIVIGLFLGLAFFLDNLLSSDEKRYASVYKVLRWLIVASATALVLIH